MPVSLALVIVLIEEEAKIIPFYGSFGFESVIRNKIDGLCHIGKGDSCATLLS